MDSRGICAGDVELPLTRSFIQDYEGHTAFDVYNSTVENTRPTKDSGAFDLFTWGANRSVHRFHSHRYHDTGSYPASALDIRNAALGHGDANDRAYPELVNVPRAKTDDRRTGSGKFYPLQVKGVSMSKLHTGTPCSYIL